MLKSEREKMISGELYNFQTEELKEDRLRAKELLRQFNEAGVREFELRKKILEKLLGTINGEFYIEQPFFCNYGYNIHWGKNAYANYNLTILDNGRVVVGDNVMIGPNVQLLTACHPIYADERNTLFEFTKPIIIGDNVWIGGGVTVLPGVSIGKNSVIGAGSVVTKDVEGAKIVAGNPARVLRDVPEDQLLKNQL
jgi:maltose O-acetyltransferase